MNKSSVSAFLRKVHYRLFRAPKGFGKPISEEELNQGYQQGTWDFLNSIDELGNYMVVVGYIRFFAKSLESAPRILDLGCGSGNVAELLSPYNWDRYLGLDISEEAVKQAQRRSLTNSEFRVGTFETMEVKENFDFIISTGAIHYAADPIAVLKNYTKNLSDEGKFIISLWRYGPNKAIWRKIEQSFEVSDFNVVKNRKGVVWDIKVLKSR